ncbi:MAG: hypothetical protein JW934_24230 [Anaerolineae bacterium]|nr:hypothetical protein [Anaerolineae bacterium]
MSRRRFVARVVALISVSSMLGVVFLLLSVYVLLDLGPETRRAELVKTLVYALVSVVVLNALVLVQLHGVLCLLRVWDRGQTPDEHVLQRAQQQALIFPNRLIAELAAIAVVLAVISVYVDVAFSGYQLVPVLINVALTSVFLLGIGFAIDIGLRVLLHPILVRIPLPPLPAWGRFSVGMRIVMILLLVVSIVAVAAGAFAYSYVIKSVDEFAGQELAYRLEQVVVPALRTSRFLQIDLEAYARSGEEFFILNRAARYVEWAPARDLSDYEKRLFAQAQSPVLYKRDYSSLCVVAVSIDKERVLGLVYDSPAMRSASAQAAFRIYIVLAVISLGFTAIIGLAASRDLVRTLNYVTQRMETLVEQADVSQISPVSHTSLDEIGDLVRAFNHIQQRTVAYTGQLQTSVQALETASLSRQQLLDTMVGLTAPVIPVAQGLAVVLLSGYFDEERAAHIRPNLLRGVARARAQMAIVDLTAVAQVSAPLTEQLSVAIRSVMLMGCQVVLTGVGPDLAWTLSQAGTELDDLPTRRNLEDGLMYAYDQLSMN